MPFPALQKEFWHSPRCFGEGKHRAPPNEPRWGDWVRWCLGRHLRPSGPSTSWVHPAQIEPKSRELVQLSLIRVNQFGHPTCPLPLKSGFLSFLLSVFYSPFFSFCQLERVQTKIDGNQWKSTRINQDHLIFFFVKISWLKRFLTALSRHSNIHSSCTLYLSWC